MKSILEDLYYGTLNPVEQHKPLMTLISTETTDIEKQLKENLNESQKEQFNNIIDNYLDLFTQSLEQEFIKGFKMSVSIMSQVFSDE